MFEELLVRKGSDERPGWTLTDGFLLLALARFIGYRGDPEQIIIRPSMREWQKSIRPWLKPRGDFEDQRSGELFTSNFAGLFPEERQHPNWLPFFHVQPYRELSINDVRFWAGCHTNPVTNASGYMRVSGFVHGGLTLPYSKLDTRRAEEALLQTVGMTMLKQSEGMDETDANMAIIVVPYASCSEQLSESLYLRCLKSGIHVLLASPDGFLVPGGRNRYASARWI